MLWCKTVIAFDPNAGRYTDRALTAVSDEDATLDLLTKTAGIEAALTHQRKIARLTQSAHA